MGLDTENERRSATSFLLISVLPVADGSIDLADLAHVTGVYCGLFRADFITDLPWRSIAASDHGGIFVTSIPRLGAG